MPSVLTRHAPEPVLRLRSVALPVVGVIAAATLLAGALRLVESPATIEVVTIENRSSLDVEVAVAPAAGDPVLRLGAIDAGRTARVEEVLDQGSTWWFDVRSGDERLGTLERTRERLDADGWRVVVPASWQPPPTAR